KPRWYWLARDIWIVAGFGLEVDHVVAVLVGVEVQRHPGIPGDVAQLRGVGPAVHQQLRAAVPEEPDRHRDGLAVTTHGGQPDDALLAQPPLDALSKLGRRINLHHATPYRVGGVIRYPSLANPRAAGFIHTPAGDDRVVQSAPAGPRRLDW